MRVSLGEAHGWRHFHGIGGENKLRFAFWPSFIFNKIGRFVFRFVFGSFFPQLRVFNNFSASFFGSFRFVFWPFLSIFNNFSGSFFKKGILFLFFSLKTGDKRTILPPQRQDPSAADVARHK